MSEHTADEVRSMRRSRGLDQKELALLAGHSERTIRSIEAGKRVRPDTLRDVYKALGLPTDQPAWPDDVENFVNMVAFHLSRVAPRPRRRLMEQLMSTLVDYDDLAEAARRIEAEAAADRVREEPKGSPDRQKRAGSA
jgi:transcriptional regulator with XRE-family HTH domain